MKNGLNQFSTPALLEIIRQDFEENVTDYRKGDVAYKKNDFLMSGLALFYTKQSSLLQYVVMMKNETIAGNLKNLFKIKKVPSDTHMRDFLDEVDSQELRGSFTKIFSVLQRGKVLENYIFYDGYYLLVVDGTGLFSSSTIHCENCCVKNHKDGSKEYYHQLLAGAFAHPQKGPVLPVAPEPIIKQDGSTKNDCERNASKRFFNNFRREHPHLKVIVVEDGLSSNAPHIKLLMGLNLRFILGCKPGDHVALFDFFEGARRIETVEKLTIKESINNGEITHIFEWMNKVSLNDANYECEVNFLYYTEIVEKEKKKTKEIIRTETVRSWVTDLPLTKETVPKIMRAGRARWSIENETFNTLKNQGYNFEHNYGHGYKNLSTVLIFLMLLIFLIDQIQFLTSPLLKKALERLGRKIRLWKTLESNFSMLAFDTWEQFLKALAYGVKVTSYEFNTS